MKSNPSARVVDVAGPTGRRNQPIAAAPIRTRGATERTHEKMKSADAERRNSAFYPNVRNALAVALETFFEAAYPNSCVLCDRPTAPIPCPPRRVVVPAEALLCEKCRSALVAKSVFCPRCGSPYASVVHRQNGAQACGDAFSFDCIYPLNFYRGLTRSALLKMKHEFFPNVAKALGRLFYETKREELEQFAPDCVVATPMHWTRRFGRNGVNAPDSLAKELALALGVDNLSRRVKRIRATQPQTSVETWRRIDNVAGAFRADERAFQGRRALLLDDACTTGATVSEIARVLKEVGADAVCVGAIARAGLSRRFINPNQTAAQASAHAPNHYNT